MGTSCGLNAAELDALDKLTEAINAIHRLPRAHPAEYQDLVPYFHAIQCSIMARAAVRAHPDVFRTTDEFE